MRWRMVNWYMLGIS